MRPLSAPRAPRALNVRPPSASARPADIINDAVFEEDHDEVIHDGIPVDEDTRRKLRVRAMQKLVEMKSL